MIILNDCLQKTKEIIDYIVSDGNTKLQYRLRHYLSRKVLHSGGRKL